MPLEPMDFDPSVLDPEMAEAYQKAVDKVAPFALFRNRKGHLVVSAVHDEASRPATKVQVSGKAVIYVAMLAVRPTPARLAATIADGRADWDAGNAPGIADAQAKIEVDFDTGWTKPDPPESTARSRRFVVQTLGKTEIHTRCEYDGRRSCRSRFETVAGDDPPPPDGAGMTVGDAPSPSLTGKSLADRLRACVENRDKAGCAAILKELGHCESPCRNHAIQLHGKLKAIQEEAMIDTQQAERDLMAFNKGVLNMAELLEKEGKEP